MQFIMTKNINTQITIQATPQKVWQTLTNFNNYPKWNPFIKELSGALKENQKIKVKIHPKNSKPMVFTPKITTYTKEEHIVWKGKFIIAGLFDGIHEFKLIQNANGSTTFLQNEKFKGILVKYINLENTKKGFEEMNEKLKEICES